MIWDFSVLKSLNVLHLLILTFSCIIHWYFAFSIFVLFRFLFFVLFIFSFSDIFLSLCLWKYSSFVNDCPAIIWYACYKLVIGASLRTATISKLKFKFALPLFQQNCSFSITDYLSVNDIILISFSKPFRSLLCPLKTNVGIHENNIWIITRFSHIIHRIAWNIDGRNH